MAWVAASCPGPVTDEGFSTLRDREGWVEESGFGHWADGSSCWSSRGRKRQLPIRLLSEQQY